ncbi:ASCH domain-containing protein [Uliginosibacterium sediminicola]|uniref:ASCH domain-containing protein n=1 Tax=Uliginosibacterium sediminicola TaxID=2024550 RepID=A0ABU9YVZ1_9RHOO
MSTLYLNLKTEYFQQIKAGTKPEEYRLMTDHWCKRLEGRAYDRIEIANGYPKKDDTENRIERPWRGYEIKTITHPHFGPDPVRVFAIKVN